MDQHLLLEATTATGHNTTDNRQDQLGLPKDNSDALLRNRLLDSGSIKSNHSCSVVITSLNHQQLLQME